MYALITEMYTFQSTLPRGERPQAMLKMVAEATVSIHAPTRGATRKRRLSRDDYESFNPRSHAGSDAQESATKQGAVCFNPRSHAGSDMMMVSLF